MYVCSSKSVSAKISELIFCFSLLSWYLLYCGLCRYKFAFIIFKKEIVRQLLKRMHSSVFIPTITCNTSLIFFNNKAISTAKQTERKISQNVSILFFPRNIRLVVVSKCHVICNYFQYRQPTKLCLFDRVWRWEKRQT